MGVAITPVALRKESVDRNKRYINKHLQKYLVALRKESVDRNKNTPQNKLANMRSLSARRAWIEIPAGCWRDARRAVALRKESVDRNIKPDVSYNIKEVALRKESVDRNCVMGMI